MDSFMSFWSALQPQLENSDATPRRSPCMAGSLRRLMKASAQSVSANGTRRDNQTHVIQNVIYI